MLPLSLHQYGPPRQSRGSLSLPSSSLAKRLLSSSLPLSPCGPSNVSQETIAASVLIHWPTTNAHCYCLVDLAIQFVFQNQYVKTKLLNTPNPTPTVPSWMLLISVSVTDTILQSCSNTSVTPQSLTPCVKPDNETYVFSLQVQLLLINSTDATQSQVLVSHISRIAS